MNLLIASVLGGFFASDATAFGQFMLSRPIFCGPAIGLLMGDIQAGLYVGMIMELIWITSVPLGSVVPPDSGVVASAAAYIGAGASGDRGYIVFIILALVPFGILFKRLDMIHREFNIYFAHKTEDKLNEGDTAYISRSTYLSTLLFFLKSTVFLAVIMWAGSTLLPAGYVYFPVPVRGALSEVFYVLPAVGFGTVITTFLFKRSQSKKK